MLDAALDVDVGSDAGVNVLDTSIRDADPSDAGGDTGPDSGSDVGSDAATMDPSLVAHYTCEGFESGQLPDVSGHGHDGACSSEGCPTLAMGRDGGLACSFDGSGHFVVPYNARFDPTGGFTVATWLRPSDTLANFAAAIGIAYGDDFLNSWQLFLFRADPGYGVSFVSTEGFNGGPLTVAPFPWNTWAHVVWTYDGSVKRGYMDGELATERDVAIAIDGLHDLYIGADEIGGVDELPYRGDMDDILLYDRALSGDEVRSLFGGELPSPI